MFKKLTFFTLGLFLFQNLSAQVLINEFSAANRNTLFDNYGEEEDWIELYNSSDASVDISGYFLSDKIDNPTKWAVPSGTIIPANGYFLFQASGRDEVSGGNYHTNFKITQTKNEAVVLTDNTGTVLDSYVIEVPNQLDHSYARIPDGGDWQVQTSPTPQTQNLSGFDHYADYVTISQEAGFYTGPVTLTLSTAEPDAQIHYTLNGDEPLPGSDIYTGEITIESTTVLRARTFSNDGNVLPGFISTNTFFINEDHSVKVISVAGRDMNELFGGSFSEPLGSLELFETDGTFLDEAVGEWNKHGNDSWAYAQRGVDYIARDQFGYNDDLDDEIFDVKERNDFQRLIIKAAANDNYPFEFGGAHIRDAYVHTLSHYAEMELDERTWEPCVLYLNGEYWGVYELREKVDDHDFTKEYYDQGKQWIDFIKTWGGTWQEYGSWDDWYVLHDFITTNDMSDPANYAQAAEELNMQSLVDYMVLNTHIVSADWLNWNTAWWRGRKEDGTAKKWRYALWDSDATFGHYINYTGVPDTGPNADPCDNEEIGFGGDPEGHVELVQSLLQNEEFHSLYVNRYADLNNSFFSCDYMLGLLDDMIGQIAPEMPRQIERWGGSMTEWENNVQALRDFIETRCTVLDEGIADCYDVEGPFPITVNIVPDDSPNTVKVNTFTPEAFPFFGDYFGGTTLSFTAQPAEEWIFDHWEVANTEFGPDQTALAIDLSIAEDEEITAFFAPAVPCGAPENITHEGNFTNVGLQWDGLFTALSYEVKYRELGSTEDWEIVSVVGQEHTIFGLQECVDYEGEIRAICANETSEIIAFEFDTACSTDTENTDLLLEFTPYPSPFTDYLTIEIVLSEAQSGVLEMYSMSGQRTYRRDLPNLQFGQNTIPVQVQSDLPSGTYLIKLTTDRGDFVRKVVRE